MFLRPLIALLQFTTIIPIGKTAPFDAFAKKCWLYPLAGYVTGGITGLFLFLLPTPSIVSGVLGIGIVLLITGCNHLDGLLDLGDGLMAHGSRDARIRALTDRNVGTGGIALGLIVTLLAVSSLASVQMAFVCIIVAEVFGKYTMAVMTIFGKPFHEGLHATLHRHTHPWFIIPSTLLLLPLILLPVSGVSLVLSFFLALVLSGFMIFLTARLFGGVNGDACGAAGEITRAGVLAVFTCSTGGPLLIWLF